MNEVREFAKGKGKEKATRSLLSWLYFLLINDSEYVALYNKVSLAVCS
jgi:hypothetical protein